MTLELAFESGLTLRVVWHEVSISFVSYVVLFDGEDSSIQRALTKNDRLYDSYIVRHTSSRVRKLQEAEMSLTNAYVLPTNRIPDLFQRIRDGQAPERFTQQILKDWGFASTNDRAFIVLLKALGFLSADGMPTQRYLDYRDHSRSKAVLGEAVREAYKDIFLIKESPSTGDRAAIEGKFKSFHNVSDNVSGLMAKTFFGLLPLADVSLRSAVASPVNATPSALKVTKEDANGIPHGRSIQPAGLHYNIQIHLPATKDLEVYNAIFRSLREHLFEQ